MRSFIVIMILIIAFSLTASIINVPGDQSTIQAGIDAAVDSDTVLVEPGTYIENINFVGKSIVLCSLFFTMQDTSYISQTIIDGNYDGSVITFENGEDSTSVLSGFTITNGNADEGAGIYCYDSNPTLSNLVIADNHGSAGAGMYLQNCLDISIDKIRFIENMAYCCGGGLYIIDSNVMIKNSKISDGDAFSYGGGLICYNSILEMEKAMIFHNVASFGAGIYSDNSTVLLRDLLIIENGSDNGSAIKGVESDIAVINCVIAGNGCYQHGVITCTDDNCVYIINSVLAGNYSQDPAEFLFEGIDFIFNSILYNNASEQLQPNAVVHYSNVQGGWAGDGNIDFDPMFIDPVEHDYHLADNSPCIGAGALELQFNSEWYYAPELDIEENPRPNPNGSMPDMGAYENELGEPQAGISNGEISGVDFQLSNYPNPFNPSTTISFMLCENSEVTINVYNIKGRKIRKLADSEFSTGTHSIVWNGDDNSGEIVSSGIYYYQLRVNGKVMAVKKCLLLK